MKQLIRAGVLLTIFILTLFVAAKFATARVPPTLALLTGYGFPPQTIEKDVAEWSGLPIRYIGSSVCADCHQGKYGQWKKSKHVAVSCEDCHGPAKAHLETGARPAVDISAEFCLLCHARLLAKPSGFVQVDAKDHGKQLACTTCHNPHDPAMARPTPTATPVVTPTPTPTAPAALPLIPPVVSPTPTPTAPAALPLTPHPLAGRENCLACHGSGIPTIPQAPQDHAGRTSATCLNCHQR